MQFMSPIFFHIQEFDPKYNLQQMGTSMRTAVFTENVVRGLKRWRGRARKHLKSSYSARPSVDASLDTSLSVDTSPSFSLDASYSVDYDRPLDVEQVAIDVMNEEKGTEKQPQEHQKSRSFEGFNVSKATLASEKESSFRV